jgi:hypothetical protein
VTSLGCAVGSTGIAEIAWLGFGVTEIEVYGTASQAHEVNLSASDNTSSPSH